MCERYIEWVASHMFPFENLACHPSMCPGWELNLQPVGLQASAQSTEPQQPGLVVFFLSETCICTYPCVFGRIFWKKDNRNWLPGELGSISLLYLYTMSKNSMWPQY